MGGRRSLNVPREKLADSIRAGQTRGDDDSHDSKSESTAQKAHDNRCLTEKQGSRSTSPAAR